MALDPRLNRLADKYAGRLMADPAFSFRVKAIRQVIKTVAKPEMSDEDITARSYLLACILEESHLPTTQQGQF